MKTHTLPSAAFMAWFMLLASAATHVVAAGSPPRHDLFAPPSFTPAAAADASSAPVAVWRPDLRAIVVAGKHSMVKVGKVVVELGEEIDGYRLVSVTESKAVFAKGRRRVELTMGGERADAP